MAVSQLLADVCSQLALILGHTLSYTQHRSKYAFVYMRAVARALTGGRSTRRVDLSRVIGRDLVLSEIGDSRGSRGIRIIREDVGIFAQSALGPEAERKSPYPVPVPTNVLAHATCVPEMSLETDVQRKRARVGAVPCRGSWGGRAGRPASRIARRCSFSSRVYRGPARV